MQARAMSSRSVRPARCGRGMPRVSHRPVPIVEPAGCDDDTAVRSRRQDGSRRPVLARSPLAEAHRAVRPPRGTAGAARVRRREHGVQSLGDAVPALVQPAERGHRRSPPCSAIAPEAGHGGPAAWRPVPPGKLPLTRLKPPPARQPKSVPRKFPGSASDAPAAPPRPTGGRRRSSDRRAPSSRPRGDRPIGRYGRSGR